MACCASPTLSLFQLARGQSGTGGLGNIMLGSMFRGTHSAMSLPFRPVDIEAQAKAYKLMQRGREDGVRDQPRTDDETMAPAEQAIVSAIEADRDRCLL